MASDNKNDKTMGGKKVMTPKFRVSFPSLEKPKSFNGQDAKYSVTMLFPKTLDISALKKAAHAAKIERWGKDKEKWPKGLKSPFRDGDTEKPDMEGYKGQIFVTASAKESNQPGMVGGDKKKLSGREIYAGCYARAELIAFAYPMEGQKGFGNKGVSFSLQNVQKMGEGKKFSGKKDAEEVFDEVEDSSEDEESYEGTDESDSDDGEYDPDLGY